MIFMNPITDYLIITNTSIKPYQLLLYKKIPYLIDLKHNILNQQTFLEYSK